FEGVYNGLNVGNIGSTTITGLSNPGSYYFRMRSGNACGISGNSNTLYMLTGPPGSPNTTSNPVTTITCNSFVATWGGVTGAGTYFLDVSVSPTFVSYVGIYQDLNVGALTSFNVTGLTPGTTYYYRVRAASGCATGLNSSSVTVSLVTPSAPVPAAASSISNSSFTANWALSANATTYYIDVATDPLFNNVVTGYNSLNVGYVSSYSITGLTSGVTYYYRVRASNSCATSLNSTPTISLTTL
ncbi:MAG: fibronectin type III domain-containing protein, partial [Bacteroidetes bacterium]|nr:fibronectin type III domain-containing protein [Bacteroidota bacterium]